MKDSGGERIHYPNGKCILSPTDFDIESDCWYALHMLKLTDRIYVNNIILHQIACVFSVHVN